MVGLQTLDLAIGVRVPASQPKESNTYGRLNLSRPFCVPIVCQSKKRVLLIPPALRDIGKYC